MLSEVVQSEGTRSIRQLRPGDKSNNKGLSLYRHAKSVLSHTAKSHTDCHIEHFLTALL